MMMLVRAKIWPGPTMQRSRGRKGRWVFQGEKKKRKNSMQREGLRVSKKKTQARAGRQFMDGWLNQCEG